MATEDQLLYTPEGAAAKLAQGRTTVYALMASGELRPVIDSRYTLDTIREAHTRVDTKRKRGDVVVAV